MHSPAGQEYAFFLLAKECDLTSPLISYPKQFFFFFLDLSTLYPLSAFLSFVKNFHLSMWQLKIKPLSQNLKSCLSPTQSNSEMFS